MGQAMHGRVPILLPSRRPSQMLAAYTANMHRGRSEVREMILEDIRRFSDLGAAAYVEDLVEALFRFDEAEFLAACARSAAHSAATIVQ